MNVNARLCHLTIECCIGRNPSAKGQLIGDQEIDVGGGDSAMLLREKISGILNVYARTPFTRIRLDIRWRISLIMP
jgi:hypothetical protein